MPKEHSPQQQPRCIVQSSTLILWQPAALPFFFLSLSLDIDLPLLQQHQQKIFMFKKVNIVVRLQARTDLNFWVFFDPALVHFWSQFGPFLVVLWSLSCPPLLPLCSLFGPSQGFFVLLLSLFAFSNVSSFFSVGNFLQYENHKIDFT